MISNHNRHALGPVIVALGVGIIVPCARAAAVPVRPAATIVSLNVSGQATHTPDAMDASLLVQTRGPDSRTAQTNLNQQMATVLHQLNQVAKLSVTTGGYSVTSSQHGTTWEATQSISLTYAAAPNSADAKPVLNLIGQLQADGVQLQSLTGTLQPSTAMATRDAAIQAAVTSLHYQETAIAAALGLKVGRIRSLTMGIGGIVVPMMRNVMYSAPAGSPPMVQPGNVTERVNLSATVALRPGP